MAQLWGGRFTKETDKLVYNFNASISFDQKFYKQDIKGLSLIHILFADRLNCAGKRLYFYLENTFYSPEDALLTGIKAILAEEYSRELSKKMNLAHQKRQQNNGKPVLTSKSYGYRRTADGAIEIIPEEAAVTRRMYELCADGLGGRKIAAVLAAEGVLSLIHI